MAEHESDIVSVRHAAAIHAAMPYLEEEIASMQQTTLTRAFMLMRKGELTPEQAYNTLSELNSFQTLLARLGSKMRVGQSAGARIAPIMSIEGDENG